MKRLHFQLIFFLVFILWSSSALAQIVSLEWDPNTDPQLAGYRIYYQAGTPQSPLLGTGAEEGASPIDAGPENFQIITLPNDGRVYYFAITAYDASGYESAYSNIVANRPQPALQWPGNNSSGINQSVTFSWYHEPADANTTYTLVFGPESGVASSFWIGGSKAVFPWAVTAYVLLFLLPLLMGRLRWLAGLKVLATGFVCVFLVTACGGGGSGSSDDESTGSSNDIPGVETQTVSRLSEQDYLATDLVPGKNYYWKVVAVDGQGTEVESEIFSFRTSP